MNGKHFVIVSISIKFLFQGVGGNLVAVQASRLSTALHRQGKPGEFQDNEQYNASQTCPNPYKTFCSNSMLRIISKIIFYFFL